jgi:hypothetical protein
MFLNYFNVLMLKIILKNILLTYIFLNKKYFKNQFQQVMPYFDLEPIYCCTVHNVL